MTYFGVLVDSRAKSRFPKTMDLQSRHIRTSTLMSEFWCFSEFTEVNSNLFKTIPPEMLRPTFVEQFVRGLPQTTLPHNRQWCFRFEKLKGCLRWVTITDGITRRMDTAWQTHPPARWPLFAPVTFAGFDLLSMTLRIHQEQVLVLEGSPLIPITTT